MSAQVNPVPGRVLVDLADYVLDHTQFLGLAFETARHCLIDAVGCALDALDDPECTKLLGPLVPGTLVPGGARVPGTPHALDPVKAAFDLGTMIGWLDRHDVWPSPRPSHPAAAIGGLLACADWISRTAAAAGRDAPTMRDLLGAIVQAYEIHGVLAQACEPALDPMLLTRVATTATVGRLLDLERDEIVAALSHAFADGEPLSAPTTAWIAGDATARGVQLALRVRSGEPGRPLALDIRPGPYASHVIENVQFRLDGTAAAESALGHRSRRAEGVPALEARFRAAVERRHARKAAQRIVKASLDSVRLAAFPVHAWVDLYCS